MDRREYCDRVTAVLRRLTPEERAAARAELEDHIEDHMEDLLALGYDEALAEERTMAAMGDPEEVGRALDRQYPLRWLLLGRAAVVLTVALCVQVLLGFGVLGMLFDSVAARIHPDENTRLAQVTASERLDIRIPVGDDILRVYRISTDLREVEVSVCAYDRIPGGIVAEALVDDTYVKNERGESGSHSSGRGNWWVEYKRLYTEVEPGDTHVTLEYERFGETVLLELPLPEEAVS
jgi:hypothetical protein